MFHLLTTQNWNEYALLDSGEGRKLERFKNYIIDRPEPKAQWDRFLSKDDWRSADAIFLKGKNEEGEWHFKEGVPLGQWITRYREIRFIGRLTPFGHIGYFPDKKAHWDLITEYLKNPGKKARVLNLFAYTGVASLVAAKLDAEVTHLDSSKSSIQWGKENQVLSGLEDKAIRWIQDDASKFVERELRRKRKYDFIMLDPPRFGHGAKKETWEIYSSLPLILENCKELLEKKDSALVLNTYSLGLDHQELGAMCYSVFKRHNLLSITTGQLAIKEDNERKKIIPLSEFCLIKF